MLYQGDNLTILKSIETASIDLIYIDPPFNKGKTFTAKNGSFEDKFASKQDYLNFLELRLRECHRILKPTGSIYIHLDPSISHYVKVLMDEIFNESNYRNEIVWCYKSSHSPTKYNYQQRHDIIFYYSKGDAPTFHHQFMPYTEDRLKQFNKVDEDGRVYRKHSHGNGKERRVYLDESNGVKVLDWWADIHSRGTITQDKQWTNYPTQKPIKLLERIIKASSNEGDVVLDAFCGSGTTCVAAKNLGRQWIGIDSNPEAIAIAKSRLSPEGTML